MTLPVLPPEPPPIVQILPPETSRSVSNSAPEPSSANQSVAARALSWAESSQLSAPKRAELLGPTISVGYPVDLKTTNPSENSIAGNALESSRAIQPLRVDDISTTSTIAKLKKFTANPSLLESSQQRKPPLRLSDDDSTAVDAATSSRAIQPLRVSDVSTNSTIAKLKELAASEITVGPPKPIETQPATLPIPIEEQRQPVFQPAPVPVPTQSPSTPQPGNDADAVSGEEQSPLPNTPPVSKRIIELTSDRQEYDEQRQIVTAEGNVLLRLEGTVVDADRVQVNLPNLIAVGEGNVALTSGQQVVRGERFTYSFVQNSGELLNARGEIYVPTAGSDFSGTLPTDVTAGVVQAQPQSARITANQPLQQVASPGGLTLGVGSGGNISGILPQIRGDVKRLRFEAEAIDFYPAGWQARNARITNDPFSPPELELRADTVTLTRERPYLDRIRTTRQRLVFDQGLSVPVPKDEAVIDRRQREPAPGGIAQIGYDEEDRGGLYIERTFSPLDTPLVRVSLTPQFFTQQAVTENGGNIFDPALYGLRSRLDATLGPRTSIRGVANFNNLELSEIGDELRASLRLRQTIGETLPHTLSLEYSYRDRLYNGSLGYQTVRSSVGGIFSSPVIPIGKTGINLSYQAGAQYINSDSDRLDLLEPIRENNRISLSRFQGSAALSRWFLLWQGTPLPATAKEGLRYAPAPVVPYLGLIAGLSGTSSFYTNGDNQTLLTGTIGIQGQIGHFSRPFLDYTAFNIIYSQGIRSGDLSPFLFDRAVDTRTLSAGITQQIYGPLRLGVQTTLSLDTGESYSTDITLEYSRRTYGITLRYNPDKELGSLNLRISDFNWVGGGDPFSQSEVRSVVDGVRREND